MLTVLKPCSKMHYSDIMDYKYKCRQRGIVEVAPSINIKYLPTELA